MSNELTLSLSGSYSKNAETITLPSVTALGITITGNQIVRGILTATTAEIAIPLSGIVPRWAFFKNMDNSATIKIKASSGGVVLAALLPGEAAAIPLDATITAPTYVAGAGTPLLEVLLLPN